MSMVIDVVITGTALAIATWCFGAGLSVLGVLAIAAAIGWLLVTAVGGR